MIPIRIELAGTPEPYRERQRAFQTGKGGRPITYSYKAGGTPSTRSGCARRPWTRWPGGRRSTARFA